MMAVGLLGHKMRGPFSPENPPLVAAADLLLGTLPPNQRLEQSYAVVSMLAGTLQRPCAVATVMYLIAIFSTLPS